MLRGLTGEHAANTNAHDLNKDSFKQQELAQLSALCVAPILAKHGRLNPLPSYLRDRKEVRCIGSQSSTQFQRGAVLPELLRVLRWEQVPRLLVPRRTRRVVLTRIHCG